MDAALLAALGAIVGDDGLIGDAVRRKPYECDGLTFHKRAPDLVLLPENTEQTVHCMRLLCEAGVPVVPRGAGTGLAGGATPLEGGVVVGTARMRRVLEVDVVDRFARVEAGLVNLDLSRACATHGLFYAPDPSSQMACTIGGNVANNSGGPHCFKYGATTRHILGLKIVTPEGEVLDLSEPEVDPTGYDLVGLFVGSEGMFGLATEITTRLVPLPEVTETLLAVFPSLEACCDSVTEIIAARLEPSAIEILDRMTIQAVEASVYAAGYPEQAEAVLLLESEGSAAEVGENVADMRAILVRHGVLEERRARDEHERARLWAGRKGAFGAMGRIAPDLYVADVVVPRTKLRELVLASTRIAHARGLTISNVFHAGDGNLHPNISYDRRDADEVERVLDAGREIMKLCVAAGGSLSGEHGIGLEKREEMELVFDPPSLERMLRVRSAWDRDGRMNPGKLIPVRVCMELRTPPPAPISKARG
ncbi:MAG: FAD-binding oxidoreductase [Planctomycetes bacterium]|jgi:glycolate oxidase subunit GlcD|nr:FAD-binding oxidoreductase [Planctomycetota bacterium]MDP6409340.1 FAD-linked oxidase C-terminal domain-containing protein [Planctomycetota bacterium]